MSKKIWSVSAYRIGNFKRIYLDMYVLNKISKYKKTFSKEDRLLLEGLMARKYGFYRSLFEDDNKKKEELLEYCAEEIKEDIKEIGYGRLSNYNIKR